MLLVSDVHGAFGALAKVAALGEPLLVLGDLLNFVDHRTHEGMLAEVAGRDAVARVAELRSRNDWEGARRVMRDIAAGREEEIRHAYRSLIDEAHAEAAAALAGSGAVVTFGNVDHPGLLAAALPEGVRFVESGVIEVEGLRIGVVGGGLPSVGGPGEVSDDAMRERLDSLGDVDVLCTHVAPAVPQLCTDVVGGLPKGSTPVKEYLLESGPRWHYFGDVHQPQATRWRVGRTACHNVGYFRATGRPVRHSP